MYCGKRVSVVIPALNEEKSIAFVIRDLPKDIVDDIIVVDNGSSDETVRVATSSGANVVYESIRGYGAACLKGIKQLVNTEILVILDGDYSDYPQEVVKLIDPIVMQDYDMVLGSRTLGRAEKGSLTLVQKFGNRLATFLIQLFTGFKYTDMGPFRAIRLDAYNKLRMQDKNYGWNVEMQMKAIKYKLKVKEVPVDYKNRIGKSKISGTVSGVIKAGTKIIYSVFKYA